MPCPSRAPLLTLLLALFAAGCSGARDRVYNIAVQNRTSGPVTIGLVKNGGPFEPAWAAPEDIAVDHPAARNVHWGHLVAPGSVGEFSLHGLFHPRVNAVLRIYDGERSLYELLAMSREDSGRVNVLVPEGPNAVVVIERGGGLEAHRVPPGSLPPPPARPAPPPPLSRAFGD